MTRLEAMKDPARAAEILCDLIQEAFYIEEQKIDTMWSVHVCDCCPANEWCKAGSPGFIEWLKKEDE